MPDDPGLPVVSEPIFRYRLVVVAAGQSRLRGTPQQWRWLVDPSGTDPGSDTGQLLAALRVPEDKIGVFPNQTAAWAAAADGAGSRRPSSIWSASNCAGASCPWWTCRRRPTGCWQVTLLERQHRSTVASALRRFLTTPEAMQLMRAPTAGVPPSRFRPPVYVTIWS